MARAILALALLVMLAGCAQGPSLQQRLGSFVGLPEGDLVAALGVPTRIHEADGRRFLQYEERRTVALPSSPIMSPYGYGRFGPRYGYWPQPQGYAVTSCDVTFSLREGRVESFTARGNGC